MRFKTFIYTSFILVGLASSSCELINPDERIPGFLCIDTIAINPGVNQGTDMHDIVDAWVYANEELVGVYELPANVPILNNGPTEIRIEPGIKVNGQAAARWGNEFYLDFEQTINIFPDSVICVSPVLPYENGVDIPWAEDFEVSSQISLTTTSLSEENVQIVSGEEAFQGKSAKLSLPVGKSAFECRSTTSFPLPTAGSPVTLEFNYKCNHPFVVSMLSITPLGTVQTPIVSVSATDEWKYMYVSLSETASSQFTASGHQPVFGYIRTNDDQEINVYLDNIRLTHF